MDARAIAIAIPLFFLLIGVEKWATRRLPGGAFRFADSISSLSCGVGQQALALVFGAVSVGGYALVYEHLRVMTISPRSGVAWVVLLLALDFCYFLYHWASHRVAFFWATHAVHHQSEEYNLTTALRQSWLTSLTSWIFYLPLAIAGFPPLMFVAMLTANTLYQFWIHTRAVSRLGFLEAFLNTPSHHRVHHGINPIYIDRNYGGIFIVWDRLFGTFQREEQEPVYGTVKPLSSFNPLWANIEPFIHLGKMAWKTRRLRDKLLLWIMPPGWHPADLGGPGTIPEVSRSAQQRYGVWAPRGLNAYVLLGFALISAATGGLLLAGSSLPEIKLLAVVAWVIVTLVTWGALLEAKPWAVPLEWARLALAVALAAWLAAGSSLLVPVTAAAAMGAVSLAIWVGRYRRRAPKVRAALSAGAALGRV